jgi:hypothetical protein
VACVWDYAKKNFKNPAVKSLEKKLLTWYYTNTFFC